MVAWVVVVVVVVAASVAADGEFTVKVAVYWLVDDEDDEDEDDAAGTNVATGPTHTSSFSSEPGAQSQALPSALRTWLSLTEHFLQPTPPSLKVKGYVPAGQLATQEPSKTLLSEHLEQVDLMVGPNTM